MEVNPAVDSKLLFDDFTPDFTKNGVAEAKNELSWQNISYTIGSKQILHDITGSAKSGELVALMGPSGAGKTTLLNILANRIRNNGNKIVTGDIKCNGNHVDMKSFRKSIAYVMQQDALVATATSRESLEFSAKLRLPNTTSQETRNSIVDDLLRSLGLEHVENSYIGDEMTRGLSGGEKKRVAIGVELVTNPQILFLDEPTSGLDSYSAWKVVQVLKALSRAGCIVVCTIHQPSSETFNLFDKVLLLSRGHVMFNGLNQNLIGALANSGYTIPENTNPADYAMLIAQTVALEDIPKYNEDKSELTMKAIDEESTIDTEESNSLVVSTTASFWVQLVCLAEREFKDTTRNRTAFLFRIGITIFMGLLFALIFKGVGNFDSPTYMLQSHFGALTNLFISALFSASQPPLLTFPMDRVVFLREYSTGSYGTIPYLLSKLMVELPTYLLVAVLQVVVSYWLQDLHAPVVVLILEVWLVQVVAASYAFFVGALVSSPKQAQEIAPLLFVPQLLFLGFFVSVNQIPEWLRWVQYLCALKYGLNLGMISEFGPGRCGTNETNIRDCAALLERSDVNTDQVWLYVLLLAAIFFLFRTGSVLGLVWRARNYSS